MNAMLASDLPLPRIGRGKVRDIYAVGDDRVLLLTTDRISAFDVVMAETIPMKGAVLTQISAWWFAQLEGVVPHHMMSADVDEIIDELPTLKKHRADLLGRAMLCRLTTDRISAFDVVMAETIPMKGAVLTQISAWWFQRLEGVVPHHMISADADEIIKQVPALQGHRADIAGRAMLCRRTTVFPIECVIRGYLSGSAWKEYAQHGTLAGEKLPSGLLESAKLAPAIFSPATKAETGHDENITVGRMRDISARR